ncbi:MAG TPA: DUF4118 domain-containing protein [Vicinamibacterales bacterium]|nr:DUF4118 domain-containing protein [Vicinamibacterales bacterium]
MTVRRWAADLQPMSIALAVLAGLTVVFAYGLHVTNVTTVALAFLLVVLVLAARARLRSAVIASVVAMLLFNFFFLPPVGTFTIADPQNWIALLAFLAVALVASNLSYAARARASEAFARRDELARLFDLSRDVLSTGDTRDTLGAIAGFVARRFSLDEVAICLPSANGWTTAAAPRARWPLDPALLAEVLENATRTLEFDARQRAYGGHRRVEGPDGPLLLVPIRLGPRAIGVLAAAGRELEPGAVDAIGGLVAIAIERAQFLREREAAELSRRTGDLKSALLASLAHDLRTPLTAIRVAATNMQDRSLSEAERIEQGTIVLSEVQRLQRLFQNVLDMARLDADSVNAAREWVAPDQIVEAARSQAESLLKGRTLHVRAADGLVDVDPRLTATALAHVLENAAQYSPADAPIEVDAALAGEGLRLEVRDHGRGISPAELPHLFDGFYRGANGRTHPGGTGLGLTIARRLLAVEQGQIWAENCADGGARFCIAVPAGTRRAPEAIDA